MTNHETSTSTATDISASDTTYNSAWQRFARSKFPAVMVVSAVATAALVRQEVINDILQRQLDTQTHHAAEEDARLRHRIDRLGSTQGALSNIVGTAITGEGLRSPSELPGHAMKGGDKSPQLAASSVKLVKRPKGSNAAWQPSCSANKVTIDKKDYFQAAAHCFKERYTVHPQSKEPYDVASVVTDEYAIMPPREVVTQSSNPLAYIGGISMDMHTDIALLQPTAENDAYKRISSLPLSNSLVQPKPGQEATLQGMPGSNETQPVQATGTYLGRVNNPETNALMDIVGVPSIIKPNTDPCSYGASGSAALLAQGYLTGPLAYRNNITFSDGLRTGGMANPPDDAANQITSRFALEGVLGVDTMEYPTLCQYTVAAPDLAKLLAQGFGNYPPAAIVYEDQK